MDFEFIEFFLAFVNFGFGNNVSRFKSRSNFLIAKILNVTFSKFGLLRAFESLILLQQILLNGWRNVSNSGMQTNFLDLRIK